MRNTLDTLSAQITRGELPLARRLIQRAAASGSPMWRTGLADPERNERARSAATARNARFEREEQDQAIADHAVAMLATSLSFMDLTDALCPLV
jgi:hypothetical protein